MSCCGQGRRALARPRPPAAPRTAPAGPEAQQVTAAAGGNVGWLALGRALARHREAWPPNARTRRR